MASRMARAPPLLVAAQHAGVPLEQAPLLDQEEASSAATCAVAILGACSEVRVEEIGQRRLPMPRACCGLIGRA
jgi:hypothetical protein